MTHPMHPLVETDDGTWFQGDLTAGQSLARLDRVAVVEQVMGGVHKDVPFVNVWLCDGSDKSTAAEWGTGATEEIAWRYALGAMFGPVDENYDESALIAMLQVVAP